MRAKNRKIRCCKCGTYYPEDEMEYIRIYEQGYPICINCLPDDTFGFTPRELLQAQYFERPRFDLNRR